MIVGWLLVFSIVITVASLYMAVYWREQCIHARSCRDAAIPLVQFAVANLDPSQVIWPYEQLEAFGKILRRQVDTTYHMRELGGNLVDFADEFRTLRKKYEQEREEKRVREVEKLRAAAT